MRGNKKYIIYAAVILILLSTTPIEATYFMDVIDSKSENESTKDIEEKTTYVIKIVNKEINIELTKSEAYNLEAKIKNIINNNAKSDEQKLDEILKEFASYGITSSELNVENIHKIIESINVDTNNENVLNMPKLKFGNTHTTIGPHFMFYVSFAGMAVPFPIGIEVINGSVRDIVDILNITDPNIEKLLENVSIFKYAIYSSTLLLFGGPLGYYFSVGLVPTTENTYTFAGPFFGIFCHLIGVGIYIYEKGTAVEKPLLDVYLAFSILSIVQEISTGDC